MPTVKKLVETSQVFLLDVLPKASSSVAWDKDTCVKAFRWSDYCEQMHHSIVSSDSLEDLNRALASASRKSTRPSAFLSRNLEKAPVLLLEEFLRNPHLSDEMMLLVVNSMSEVFPPPKFLSLCEEVTERKAIYHKAISLVQENSKSETMTEMKALILRKDLLLDLTPSTLLEKLNPLMKTVSLMELLLTVFSLSLVDTEESPERQLCKHIIGMMESLVGQWLRGESKGYTIAPLTAAPVKLTRKLCESSCNFLELWLKCLGSLADRLTVVFYSKDHVWSWPDDDMLDGKEARYQGLWFSFDQLVHHMQSLLLSANEDDVALKGRQYISSRMQLPNCSLWLQVEQRLSIAFSSTLSSSPN